MTMIDDMIRAERSLQGRATKGLSASAIDNIEARYRAAHAAGDIGALAILAVETMPSLISAARKGQRGGQGND